MQMKIYSFRLTIIIKITKFVVTFLFTPIYQHIRAFPKNPIGRGLAEEIRGGLSEKLSHCDGNPKMKSKSKKQVPENF